MLKRSVTEASLPPLVELLNKRLPGERLPIDLESNVKIALSHKTGWYLLFSIYY